jgi:dolichol-phosphate mannosyltransferase
LPGSTTPLRTFGNRLTSGYASLLTGHPLSDVLSGIKAWSRAAIDGIGLRSDGYSYEVELPMRALGCGLRVMEVPVTTQARHAGRSHVSPLRDGARILFDISRFGWVAR